MKAKNLIALTALAFALAGCATADETVAPDGRRAYSLDCSGFGRTWAMCLTRAGEVCPSGYDVLASNNAAGGQMFGGTANTAGATVFGTPIVDRSMLIACC